MVERPGARHQRRHRQAVGEAERLVPRGFRRGAGGCSDALRAGEGDDRALVMLWRG
jgi:hypothetical protein